MTSRKKELTCKTKKVCFSWVRVPIYRFNVYWKRCSLKDYALLCKNEFDAYEPPHGDGACQVYTKKGQDIVVLWFSPKCKGKHLLLIKVHECIHAAHYILSRRGLKLSDDSEEAYTYLVDFLMRKLLQM